MALYGGVALDIQFLPSGVFYTSIANTLLSLASLRAALGSDALGPDIGAHLRASVADRQSAMSSVAKWTTEFVVDISAVTATVGVHKVDYLG